MRQTRLVCLQQNVGMIFQREEKSITGYLCKQCIKQYYWDYTTTTLFLGWWGLISFMVTPGIIISNTVEYIKSRRLPD